jgi:hypothetical protein
MPKGKRRPPDTPTDIATHDEVLRLLSAQARDGNVTATVALLRALPAEPDDFDPDAELRRLCGRDGDDE